jgi:hypothetical protein
MFWFFILGNGDNNTHVWKKILNVLGAVAHMKWLDVYYTSVLFVVIKVFIW